jgi:hypothetical protein
MKSNRLQLNSLKTEFLWCAASRRQNFLDHSPFVIGVDYIQPADVVRNLGLLLESDLSMTNHISRVVSTYSGILRQLRYVGRSLPRDAKRQPIQTFVLSWVDYCNVAFANIPKRQTDRLQAIINDSARLVSSARKFDHITPFLRDDLHLLKVPERNEFKLCLLVYKCMHNMAPSYSRDHQATVIRFISI